MFTLTFLILALAMKNKPGAAISLFLAAIVDGCSEVAYIVTGDFEPIYAYYVVLFLAVFAWWLVMCKLNLFYGQIISGIAVSFMAVAVVDCYLSNGYETMVSIAFPSVMLLINLLTILAAWNDRNWTDIISADSWNKSNRIHNKVNL